MSVGTAMIIGFAIGISLMSVVIIISEWGARDMPCL